jgi:hypothetical protein
MTTPSQAKNIIRKALQDVLDSQPSLSEKKRLREHFDNRCAFCIRPIDPQKRDGHIDHFVPTERTTSRIASWRATSSQTFMQALKELRKEKENQTSTSPVRFCRGDKTASES